MESDEGKSTTTITDDVINKAECNDLCKVCGSENACVHFGVVSCSSCKMFFRRNIQLDLNTEHCVFDGFCKININSRRACRYCRLKKCFSVGMQRELIRAPHHRQDHCKGKKKQLAETSSLIDVSSEKAISLPVVIPTLSLLSNDRSLLTVEQWSRLSNVVNAYNAQSPVPNVRNMLSVESTYPAKTRLKTAAANIMNIIGSMFLAIYPFVEAIPEYVAMSTRDKSALMERNIRNAGGYSGVLIFQEAKVCQSEVFKIGFSSIYGSELTDEVTAVIGRTSMDGTLIKLLTPIVMFSTCSDIVVPVIQNADEATATSVETCFLPSTKHLLEIQNIYVEMMFKYMIYQYGYNEAALRFAAIIKHFLDQSMCTIHAGEVQAHAEMVHSIVKDTERSLTLNNELDI